MWTWIILLLFLWYLSQPIVEHGSTSPGTMLQLAAKGPQDVYLTGLPRYNYYPWGYGYHYGLHPYYWNPYPYHWAYYQPLWW